MSFLISTLFIASLVSGANLDVTPEIPKSGAEFTRDYAITKAFSYTPLKERIVSLSDTIKN